MAAYEPAGVPDMDEEASPQNGEYTHEQEEDDAGEDDDDYDPSSFTYGDGTAGSTAQQDTAMPDSPQQTATPNPIEPAAKPKTVGGFIVEESDEEDEDIGDNIISMPSHLKGTEDDQSGVAVAGSEAVQDVSLASEPTQDSAAAQTAQYAQDSLNGSAATIPGVPDDLVASSSALPAPLTVQHDEGKSENISPAVAHASDLVSVSATPSAATHGAAVPAGNNAVPPTPISARLPHDKVGRLEDRIKDDPRADTQAWLELIAHYREKDQIDNVRMVYERMLQVFPTAPSVYIAYLQLELGFYDPSDRTRIDTIFGSSLQVAPSVDLWRMYLDYVRRICPLVPDPSGGNRAVITNAFDVVLNNVGIDPAAGGIWREYVDFAKSGPGIIGGSGWQDQQKGDLVRNAYQRAVKVPSGDPVRMWKEYDNFEMSINKQQGRKYIQDLGPHYMSARSERAHLEKLTDGLDRHSLPILPPVHGYEGEDQFGTQVYKWRQWIDWEKSDPLAFRTDEIVEYRKRVLYVYKQATIQLRFYPDIWFEAAQWCFEELVEEFVAHGDDFIEQGIRANPESVLLALKKADRLEESFDVGNTDDETIVSNGNRLDVPFEECHKALYGLREKMVEREKKALQEVREHFNSLPAEEEQDQTQAGDDDDDEPSAIITKPISRQQQMEGQMKAISASSRAHIETLKRTISYIWVAKMRAFRRVQGQGIPGKPKKGFRGVFAEARPRGQLSSEVYISSALMEWHCYKDPSALKIFERGLKLFPQDQDFALAYVKFLVECRGDLVNARVVFETTLTKILGSGPKLDAEKVDKEAEEEQRSRKDRVRGLLGFMHGFESAYGDMAQIRKLEKRMKELFPNEPEIVRFGTRNLMPTFDGLQAELVISPSQARPRRSSYPPPMMGMGMPGMQPPPGVMQSLEAPQDGGLRLGPNGPYVASPKRPLDDADMDTDTPQRKFMRGESPLKGAAGRRIGGGGGGNGGSSGMMNGHMATNSIGGGSVAGGANGAAGGFMTKNFVPGMPLPNGMQAPPSMPSGPTPLPRDIIYLLSILPHASRYDAPVTFAPAAVLDLVRAVDLEGARARTQQQAGGR